MRIAFLAPIKPPDHPIASGDRLIARNLARALEAGGDTVVLASRFVAYMKRPDALSERKAAALGEAKLAVERLRAAPPDLVLTYHPYCKAPDWIGPRIAAAFAVPYVTVEAARASVDWPDHRAEAQTGMAHADLHVWLKPTDRDTLRATFGPEVPLAHLPPFVDVATIDAIGGKTELPEPTVAIVGQMRPGKKRRNYEMAADALSRLTAPPNVLVMGDGPERAAIEAMLPNARFIGAVPHQEVIRNLRGASLMLWPGDREPIGMVYLEAAACALPVVATADMGVPLVVRDGETGLLAPSGDVAGLAQRMDALLADGERRTKIGAQARAHVVRHHSLDSATMALQAVLARFRPPS